jgi:signal transduction histidine kinase/CheY-like chemotaxis protein
VSVTSPLPTTTPDPFAEIRAEFAGGLGARIETMRTALGRLDGPFRVKEADTLFRAAHSLTGTAASFGAEGLAHVAGDLEALARNWLARGAVAAEERRAALAAVAELESAAREYRATIQTGPLRSPAARLAVVGELTSLIHAAVDMREIFRGAILKVQRVLDFRRASVVLIDDSRTTYSLHTLFDRARGGFLDGEAVFPIAQGITGEAIQTGRPVRVDGLPGTEGILLQEGKHVSAMIVPLHVNDRVIGALNFGHEDEGVYTEEDLDWAVVLGRQIETSLYYSKLLSTIAEQREALAREHALVQGQRNQLEALIDASDAAIMLVGRDHRIAHANAEMAKLVGIPREAVLGASVDSLHRFLAGSFVDPAALAVQQKALTLDATLRDRFELTFPRRAVYQRVVAPVRQGGGAPLGHIVLYRDVTHEVEVERAKSEFVSVVSHELRTPMTSVKTSLSLLLGGAAGAMGEPARELLEIAHRNADRLIRLVNDLLDLSRLEAGRMDLRLGPVNLAEAVESSVEAVTGFANEQGVAIALAPAGEAIVVHAMRDRLEQVIVNLLANAVKFSARGKRVTVRWWSDGEGAVVEVQDQGPGIAPEHLEAIFEPFRQLDSSTTREHGGVGLGLAISQNIMRALGGKLRAESEVGAGSRFFVRLPLALGQPLAPPAAPTEPGRAGPLVVLIAHSDHDWQRLAAARLQAEGWRAVPVATGAAALERLREERVDLIVIALDLADTHGIDLLQKLQRDPQLFEIPVVIVAEMESPVIANEGTALATTVEEAVEHARRLLRAPTRDMVLLVEDDPLLRPTLGKVLRRAGYSCFPVANGREALAFIRTRRPQLVITDYRMPEMNGLAFLRELRNDPACKSLPVIMLTGHVSRDLARQIADLSAELAAKPIKPKLLVATVARLIHSGEAAVDSHAADPSLAPPEAQS